MLEKITYEESKAEQWKDIDWLEEKYKISSLGRVMSYFRTVQHLMKPQVDNYGDLIVMLTKRDRELAHTIKIGKEVAKAFVPNPNGYKYIRFKDGNRMNCRAENIEWVELTEKMQKQYKGFQKKINQYDKNGNYLRTYDSLNEAGEQSGIAVSRIAKVCKEKYGLTDGFTWRYEAEFPSGENITVTVKQKPKVNQYEKDGTFIRTWNNSAEAAVGIGNKDAGNITSCCKGRRKTVYGYIWKYGEDEEAL